MGMEDALGQPGRARGEEDLGRVVGERVERFVGIVVSGQQVGVELDHVVDQVGRHSSGIVQNR